MKHLMMILVASVAIVAPAMAHEGHDHKIMGTVSARHGMQLEVKGTDGKASTITMTDKTRIVRGTDAVTADQISTGDRVVVTATQTKDKSGAETWIAKEVRLGTARQTQ